MGKKTNKFWALLLSTWRKEPQNSITFVHYTECFDNSKLFQTIRDHFQFDQLIWEKGNNNQPDWVHVSYKANGNRNQILKFKNGTYIRLWKVQIALLKLLLCFLL